jgi:ABC-type transport system involved in cytochrome bd biosynthesis fused ATPase/permease subunit
MNVEAEKFRKITMKVLTMQLNSITIMDLIAYGGAALGVIMAATQFRAGHVSMSGALLIILLAADFFIPMRQLGSFFHIAMNGMAASDKIFRLLDMPENPQTEGKTLPNDFDISCSELGYAYSEDRQILSEVNLSFPKGSFTAIVGESGCGKSTTAAILMGRNRGYTGSVRLGAVELSAASEKSLMERLCYVGHQSYLFKGSVRDNLLMGRPGASDIELWDSLEKVKLAAFLRGEQGLDTELTEQGGNLSGGQRQRLAMARALLHDCPVYIFDEATSNIDVESENEIMEQIHALAKRKTVILISHRLANVVDADNIYVMDKGCVVESGNHNSLLGKNGLYTKLWQTQQDLENFGKESN